MDLKNKTVILTGAARVGQSVAEALAGEGANLLLTYLESPDEVKEASKKSEKFGIKIHFIQADLSKNDDVARVVGEAKKTFGQIDVLVHMAANYPRNPWEKLKEADWDLAMNVIAKSTFLLGKAVGDELLQNEGDLKGKIITISDWSVLTRPYKGYLPYNTAKAAVVGLTKSLASELAPYVLVNTIAPGPILAPPGLTREENEEVLRSTPLKRWGGPEEIAKAVLYLLHADFVTGQVLFVDGGRSIA